jgi:hypothetical protein
VDTGRTGIGMDGDAAGHGGTNELGAAGDEDSQDDEVVGPAGLTGRVGFERRRTGSVLGPLGPSATGAVEGISLWHARQVKEMEGLRVSQTLHLQREPRRALAGESLSVADALTGSGTAGFAVAGEGVTLGRSSWHALHFSALCALYVSHSRHCHVLAIALGLRGRLVGAVRQHRSCWV